MTAKSIILVAALIILVFAIIYFIRGQNDLAMLLMVFEIALLQTGRYIKG